MVVAPWSDVVTTTDKPQR